MDGWTDFKLLNKVIVPGTRYCLSTKLSPEAS